MLASANCLAAAASRIEDTDFAKEAANLAKNSVLNQSAMAMVAQANQAQSAMSAVLAINNERRQNKDAKCIKHIAVRLH